jgi:hypothetical protein
MMHYVYAGAAPWSGASPTDQPGGLFRQAMGSYEWQHLSNGLPEKAEIRAIAIHPQNSQIVYIGTQDGGKTWTEYPLPAAKQDVYALACG